MYPVLLVADGVLKAQSSVRYETRETKIGLSRHKKMHQRWRWEGARERFWFMCLKRKIGEKFLLELMILANIQGRH